MATKTFLLWPRSHCHHCHPDCPRLSILDELWCIHITSVIASSGLLIELRVIFIREGKGRSYFEHLNLWCPQSSVVAYFWICHGISIRDCTVSIIYRNVSRWNCAKVCFQVIKSSLCPIMILGIGTKIKFRTLYWWLDDIKVSTVNQLWL